MIRLFKKRSFIHGTFVAIKVSDNKHRELIKEIIQLCSDNNIRSIGPGQSGDGGYFRFHRKDDARIIKNFVNEWTRKQKAEIKKNKWRS